MMIYITGHTGYIGSKLLQTFASNTDCKVVTIGRSESSGIKWNLESDDCDFILEEGSVVIHLAGVSDEKRYTSNEMDVLNTKATQSLAQVAKKSKASQFIFLSTCAVYAPSKEAITERTEPCPLSPYGQSKLLAERELTNTFNDSHCKLTILRPSSVYGLEKNSAQSTVAMLMKGLSNKKFLFLGDGSNKKSFVHVNDVNRAVSHLAYLPLPLENRRKSSTYILSSDTLSTRTLIDILCKKTSSKKPMQFPVSPIRLAIKFLTYFPIINRKTKGIENSLNKWLSHFEIDGEDISRKSGFEYAHRFK